MKIGTRKKSEVKGEIYGRMKEIYFVVEMKLR